MSEQCLAEASPRAADGSRLVDLEPRSVVASPSTPNIARPQALRDALAQLAPAKNRMPSAALVIPDYAVRMSILDFEQFPAGEVERQALLRFRLRKSVPFHIEEAQVSYAVQHQDERAVEVLAVVMARPILDEYEKAFADVGYRVGLVTPSSVAALPLFNAFPDSALTLVVKLAGTAVSVLLLQRGRLRLVRCIDLTAGDDPLDHAEQGDMLPGIIQQTLAYAEDQVKAPVDRLLICGGNGSYRKLASLSASEFQVPCSAVQSRFGAATPENAGLFGLLEQYTR